MYHHYDILTKYFLKEKNWSSSKWLSIINIYITEKYTICKQSKISENMVIGDIFLKLWQDTKDWTFLRIKS
jgi:hypothetical protein